MKNKILLIFCLLLFPINILALEIKHKNIMINGNLTEKLSDDNYNTKEVIKRNAPIDIRSDTPISHIYIIYELTSKTGTLTVNNKNIKIGSNGYLHEYIDLSTFNSNQLLINYDEDVIISEIYVFDESELPSWVQKWTLINKADLMILPTHSDDEHLFFAGLIPTYIDKGLKIQVVYLTNHNTTPKRLHEQLNGLWTVGLTNYPVIGPFPDAYSTSLEGALKELNNAGYTLDDVIKFQVNNIRKYQPFVIAGHAENGEYGHGQHILNTFALKTALLKAMDSFYESSYQTYEVPKTYLHLYKENQIIMNYDIPLTKYNGSTAYEISKLGYLCHKSQQYTWFTDWFFGKNNSYNKATEIRSYSPLEFGLYKSIVGEDRNKNDMFENIDFEKSNVISFSIYEFNKRTINKKGIYLLIIVEILIISLILFIVRITKESN